MARGNRSMVPFTITTRIVIIITTTIVAIGTEVITIRINQSCGKGSAFRAVRAAFSPDRWVL